MPTEQELDAIHAACLESPQWFFNEILGCTTMYEKQVEMACAIRDLPQVAVCGCNSSGKDWTAGRMMLWWLGAYYPSKVAVFGPSNRQIQDIVFAEARASFEPFSEWFGMRMPPAAPRIYHNEQHFALGFSTDKDLKLTGFHSPNLLVIITEAHGMRESDIDKIFTLKPKSWLLTGNPFSNSGTFFDAFHTKKHQWYGIKIAAKDSPNVQQGRVVTPGLIDQTYVDQARVRWGEGSPMYKASVEGEFSDALPGKIVPLGHAIAASQRQLYFQGPTILSLDVGGDGKKPDQSVLVKRQGFAAEILLAEYHLDEPALAERVITYLANDLNIQWIVIDCSGIGAGVAHILKRTRWARKIVEFRGGARAANPTRFRDAITEAYWHMRLAYQSGLAIAKDDDLIHQVSSRDYYVRRENYIELEPKDHYIAAGNHSPDKADALAMSFAQFQFDVYTADPHYDPSLLDRMSA